MTIIKMREIGHHSNRIEEFLKQVSTGDLTLKFPITQVTIVGLDPGTVYPEKRYTDIYVGDLIRVQFSDLDGLDFFSVVQLRAVWKIAREQDPVTGKERILLMPDQGQFEHACAAWISSDGGFCVLLTVFRGHNVRPDLHDEERQFLEEMLRDFILGFKNISELTHK